MYTVISWTPRRLTGWLAVIGLCCMSLAVFANALPPVTVGTTPTKGVRLPIVMYHGLLPDTARQGDFVIDPALFESDLAYLKKAGYETVTVADLLAYVHEGASLPEKAIMLTFDDGYYNNYLYAFPLLKQYGMQMVLSPIGAATTFYNDNPKEQNHEAYSHVTWAQLREMAESGLVEIQSHSYDLHQNKAGGRKGAGKLKNETTAAYQAVLRQDLTAANELLAGEVGVQPTAFVYPFGESHKEARPVLEALGFEATFSCESRVNTITRDPNSLWWLGRYRRTHNQSSEAFFASLI